MPLVNPNIAMGVRPFELNYQPRNALTDYAQVIQIQNAQREQATRNALNEGYQAAYDPVTQTVDQNKLMTFMANKGYGSQIPGIQKGIMEAKTAQVGYDKAQQELANSRMKESRNLLTTVNTPEGYAQWRAYAAKQMPGIANMIPEQYSPQTVQQLMLEADKYMELNKPQLSTKDIGGTVIDRTFQPLTGQITEVARTAKTMAPGEAERIANEQKRITQDARRLSLEDRRLAVMEENQRRDADPVFQQQMAAAKETGIKAAQGDVAAQQALPKVIAGAEQSIKMIDDLIGKRDSTTGKLLKGEKVHPGFSSAVGATWLPGARFIPGTDAANFMARFDQVKGASFLQAFEALKGGGAITEKEGQKGTDAINRMSTSQSEDEFIRAAMDLQDVIRKGVENAQKRASRSASTVPVSPAAPAAGGVKFLGFE